MTYSAQNPRFPEFKGIDLEAVADIIRDALDTQVLTDTIIHVLKGGSVPNVTRPPLPPSRLNPEPYRVALVGSENYMIRAAAELLARNPARANSFLGTLKQIQPMQQTKHVRGNEYMLNPFDQCLHLSTMWLRAQFHYGETPHRRSRKKQFYEAAHRDYLVPRPTPMLEKFAQEQTRNLYKRFYEKNVSSPIVYNEGSNNVSRFINKLLDMDPIQFYYVQSEDLSFGLSEILRKMMMKGIKSLGIFMDINFDHVHSHAMAMMLKVKDHYITVNYFDPNDPADLKVALNLNNQDEWEPRMDQIFNTRSLIDAHPAAEIMLVCFCPNVRECVPLELSHVSQHSLARLTPPDTPAVPEPNWYYFEIFKLIDIGDSPAFINEFRKFQILPNFNVNFVYPFMNVTMLTQSILVKNYVFFCEILNTRNVDINLHTDPSAAAAIHFIIIKNLPNFLRRLVQERNLILTTTVEINGNHYTPLLLASTRGYTECVQILMEEIRLRELGHRR